MEGLVTIFREVRDPRDFNARHDLSAMLFLALAATLCGAKSCVEIADFAEANAATLGEIVDLAHGVPSHDSFSRLFRLLDPDELAAAFAHQGQIPGCGHQLGRELQRALVLLASAGQIALLLQNRSQVGMSRPGFGLDRDRFPIGFRRIFNPAELPAGDSEIEPRLERVLLLDGAVVRLGKDLPGRVRELRVVDLLVPLLELGLEEGPDDVARCLRLPPLE